MNKLRVLILMMLILTLTLVFTGCGLAHKVDNRLEQLEDRIENDRERDRNAKDVVLTREEAENIALTHAEVVAADAQAMRTELDRDDGVPVYEVGFYANRTEYEYTIHAESGKILEYDVDR